jgi:hypothetical protein
MEMVQGSAGWESMATEQGVFLLARLQAEPKMKDLAAFFAARQEALETKGAAYKAAKRSISNFEAAMVKADFDMDNMVRDLYFSKLGACANNKKDPAILRWFPDGLSGIIRDTLEGEAGKVAALLIVLGESPDDPIAARVLPSLKAMLATYQSTQAALSAAITAASNARTLVEAEKINWLGAYQKSYADVLALSGGNKRTADSFFKKASKPPKKGGGDAPPAAAK